MGAFSSFQTAVDTALVGEPTVTALVSTRIFDDVPHESDPVSTVFPRITIGDQTGEEAGTSDSDLTRIELTLHVWSRAAGRKECLDIMHATVKALHKRTHLVSQGVIVDLLYASHETAKEADGETYHGAIRFSGLLQYS